VSQIPYGLRPGSLCRWQTDGSLFFYIGLEGIEPDGPGEDYSLAVLGLPIGCGAGWPEGCTVPILMSTLSCTLLDKKEIWGLLWRGKEVICQPPERVSEQFFISNSRVRHRIIVNNGFYHSWQHFRDLEEFLLFTRTSQERCHRSAVCFSCSA
jgi:hypothetical protein